MKRCFAVLLSVLLLVTYVLPVSADGYNDDQFDWGEYACTHSVVKSVDAVASTCITHGHDAYTRCVECAMLLSGSDEDLPLGDHAYDHACDIDCNVCGETRETIHDYRDTVITPDCENSGYVIHTCFICGDTYVDDRVDALGHRYQLIEVVNPTCVTDGKKVYVCQNCDDSYTEAIPATGQHTYEFSCDETCDECGYVRDDAHNFIFMGTVGPTCGEDGWDGYKCWACGTVDYVMIPATGKHTYRVVCDGECNVCGQHREGIAQHDYRLTATVEVTCITDGKHTYTCTGCGDSYSEIVVAQGHKYDIVITKPDCENGGYTTHTCSVCGDVQVDNRVDALGHTWVDASCYEPKHCSTCGKTEGDVAHGDIIHVEAVAATCTAMGNIEYWYCADCGQAWLDEACTLNTNLQAVKLPATGEHIYDDDRDTDCNVCGAVREPLRTPGDLNGDGNINNRDLALMQQYLNGWDVTADESAADVTGDGNINNRDLALLQQYLNGWDVTLK